MRLLIPSLIFLCGLVIYGGVVIWRMWIDREQSRSDQERRRLDLVSPPELTEWKPPYGTKRKYTAQRAAGFNHKRIS